MKKQDVEKRDREREAFESFMRLSNRLVTTFRHGEVPEPDIIATVDGLEVGIEVTGLNDEGWSRRLGNSREIVETAKRIAEGGGAPQLQVSIFGLTHDEIPRSQRLAVAERLADFVCQDIPEAGGRRTFEWHSLPDALGRVITSLAVFRPTPEIGSLWKAPDARFIGRLRPSDVQGVIDKKNRKLGGYKGSYVTSWLLISCAEFAAWSEATPQIEAANYRTGFDEIFLLSLFPQQRLLRLSGRL